MTEKETKRTTAGNNSDLGSGGVYAHGKFSEKRAFSEDVLGKINYFMYLCTVIEHHPLY